jgi:hypothetical protein
MHIRRLCLLFMLLTALFPALPAFAQTDQSLLRRIDSLNDLLHQANLPPGNFDTEDIHERIDRQLTAMLLHPEAQKPDSLLQHLELNQVHAADRRLWIFNWFENSGGSFKRYFSRLQYHTSDGRLKTDATPLYDERYEPGFCSNGALFTQIHKLRSRGKDLYLCLGYGIGCNTCVFQIATVVRLFQDSMQLDYPAFDEAGAAGPCLSVHARTGNLEDFHFDPVTQKLSYSYLPDDLTPIQAEEDGEPAQRVRVSLWFNGTRFEPVSS